jgi:hypothetical protein
LRVLVADENGVKGEDESTGGVDAVLDGEGKRNGGEGAKQIDSDEIYGRDEGGQNGLTASGDVVGQERCVGKRLRERSQYAGGKGEQVRRT